MRDTKYVIAAIVILVLVLCAIGFALFYEGSEAPATETPPPFADTGAERDITFDPTAEPFANLDQNWNSGTPQDTQAAPRMRLISKEPSIGAAAHVRTFSTTTPSRQHVRYILRASGHIEETPLDIVTDAATLSEKTILRIEAVQWTRNAETALLQYVDEESDTVFSFLGQFGGVSTIAQENASGTPRRVTSGFTGRPLPNDIHTATFSPDGVSIFYIVTTNTGSTGFIESVATGVRAEVWSTPFRSVTADWPAKDAIVIHMNPSLVATGLVWVLNPTTWEVHTVLGNEYALTPLMSSDGAKILYSMQEEKNGVFSLRSLDLADGTVTYLPIPTTVEKCVWEENGSRYVYCAIPNNFQTKDFLELWHRGALVANDTIWRFDTTNGASKRIAEPSLESGVMFDIVDISISPSDKYLLFQTRNNDMLWALQLPAVPVIVEEPEEEEEE